MSTHGLYIPADVLSRATLSLPARWVLSEILNLYKVKGQVWANDQYFSNRLPGVALRTVGGAIKELVDEGFIVRVTKQNEDPKRTLTPTGLCKEALAEIAGGQPSQASDTQPPKGPVPSPTAEPPAKSARATPNHLQNPQEPIAESATDLLQDLQEAPAKSADINSNLNKRGTNTSSSSGRVGHKGTKSLSPEVKKPEQAAPAPEPWAIWIAENTPRVQQLRTPLTGKQWTSLVADFGEERVKDVLCGMENKATLLKDYTSANLTCRDWCKRRGPALPKPVPKAAAAPEPELNSEEVARNEEKRKADAAENLRRIRQGATATQA